MRYDFYLMKVNGPEVFGLYDHREGADGSSYAYDRLYRPEAQVYDAEGRKVERRYSGRLTDAAIVELLTTAEDEWDLTVEDPFAASGRAAA